MRNALTNGNTSSATENSKIAPNIVWDCHVKMWTKNSYKYISPFNPTQNMLITLNNQRNLLKVLFRPEPSIFCHKIWILSRDPACLIWRHFYLRPSRFLAVGAWHSSSLEHLPQFCTTCLASSQLSGLADLLMYLYFSAFLGVFLLSGFGEGFRYGPGSDLFVQIVKFMQFLNGQSRCYVKASEESVTAALFV